MPLSQFKCSVCGKNAPRKVLEHGSYKERMDWLRKHYKENHPRKWAEWNKKVAKTKKARR